MIVRTSDIAEQVHAFLRDQILSGQDGLSATTPLLELGILDSFGLFKLVSYLNATFSIEIMPDQIEGPDFVTIDAITACVAGRLAAKPAREMAGTPPAVAERPSAGVAVFEAPSCAQVFIMFFGQQQPPIRGRALRGGAQEVLEDVPEFFKEAGLANRNIILFHDLSNRSYKEGVSADLPTRAMIYAQLSEWMAQRPRIQEVYCLGVSAGGPMAMLAGDFLKAKVVWAFAPRTPATRSGWNRRTRSPHLRSASPARRWRNWKHI